MVSGRLRRSLISPFLNRHLLQSILLLRPHSQQVVAAADGSLEGVGQIGAARHFSVGGETSRNLKIQHLVKGLNKQIGGGKKDLAASDQCRRQATEKLNEHVGGVLPTVEATVEKVKTEVLSHTQLEDHLISDIAFKVSEIVQGEPEWEHTLLSHFPGAHHQFLFHPSCFRKVLSCQSITNSGIALRYFLWMVLQDSFCPDRSASTAIFHVLLDTRSWEAALFAIRSIKCRPDTSSLEPFLYLLCRGKALEEALEAIPIIKGIFGFIPSASTWKLALQQSLRIGRTELVWQFYEKMIEFGANIDAFVIGCLIQTFCMEKRLFEGYRLVHQVCRDGILPDIISFNRLVSGFCKEGKLEMVSEVLHLMILIGRQPEMSTYQEVIHTSCEHDMGIEAFRIFNDLKQRGYTPDVVTYNTMINGLCKMRRMDDAQELLQEMNLRGVQPNQRTYNCLVDGYSKLGNTDQAWKLYNEMVTKGLGESTIACNSIISGFCLVGKIEDSLHLFEDMRKKYIKHNIITYNTLIQGFCKEGKTAEAYSLFGELLKSGLQPCESSYTYLIRSLCEQGNVQEARELFNDMERKGLKPLVVTRDYIISGFCKVGNVDEGLLWLSNMVDANLQPSELTFNRVVGSLSLASRLDEAFLVLKLMFQFGYSLKGYICSSLICQLCHEKCNPGED